MSLASEVVAGVKWTAFARYGEQLGAFVITAVLARLVAPEAFGIFGMGMIVIGLGMLVADLGTVAAIVQRAEPADALAPSLFWVTVVMGLVLAGVTALLAPAVAWFFEEPDLVAVVRWMGLGFLVLALGTIPRGLLTRRMDFARIAGPRLAGVGAGGAVGIGMALGGFGVWSLVGQHLARHSVENVALFSVSRFRPRLRIDTGELVSVAGFSINLSGYSILGYAIRNVDNLVIGKFLGATPLGYYDVAWRLIQYPAAAISSVMSQVLLPTLSRMQEDDARLGTAYLRTCSAIALVSFPLLAGMMVLAEPFTLFLLGSDWLPVALLLVILGPVGMAQSIGSTTGSIYIAKGRTDVLFRWGLWATVGTTAAVLGGLHWGLVGVAAARLVSNTLLSPINFHLAFRLIGLRLRSLARLLLPIGGTALAMAAVVLAVRFGWEILHPPPPWLLLVVTVPLGVLVYGLGIFRLRPPILFEILSTLSQGGVGWARTGMERLTGVDPERRGS